MANRNSKLIERILKDFSLNINHGDEGGTKVVSELPEVGEEHTIYELHTTTPSKFNYVPCLDVDFEIRYVFENEEIFRDFVMNIANHYNNHNEFYCYCLAEDELMRVYYNSGSANWTLFDNEEENVFIYNAERLCICKALIDERTALLLNGKQIPIGDRDGILYSPIFLHQVESMILCNEYKYGMISPIMSNTLPTCVDGEPYIESNPVDWFTDFNSGIVQWVTNDGSIKVALPYVDGKYRYDKTEQYFYDVKTEEYYTGEFDWVDIEDFNFKDYVDYETYDSIPLSEGRMSKPFIFDPSAKTITSYWIYKNGKWVNVDEIGEPKIPIIYFYWYDGESFTGLDINSITLRVNDKKVDLIEVDNGHEAGRKQFIGYIDKSSSYSVSFEKDENLPASLCHCSNFGKVNTTHVNFDEMQKIANFTTTFEPIVIIFESRPQL